MLLLYSYLRAFAVSQGVEFQIRCALLGTNGTSPFCRGEHHKHKRFDINQAEGGMELTTSTWREFWCQSKADNESSGRNHRLLLDTTATVELVIDHPEVSVVKIPLQDLHRRRFELPMRHVSFGIIVSSGTREELEFLAQSLLVCNTPWRGRLWIIRAALDEDWRNFQGAHNHNPSAGLSNTQPPPRLWSPDPLVEHVLFPRLLEYVDQNECCTDRPLRIWDLGAGIGRDACFLGEMLSAVTSVQVTAVDQRYRNPDCNETTEFWRRRGSSATSCCRCLCLDIRREVDGLVDQLRDEQVDCVFAVRYWNRDLFSRLAHEGVVPVIAVSQFGKSHDGATWSFSTPKVC